jgi:hypothetical protein
MDLPLIPFDIRPIPPDHNVNSPWDPSGPTTLVITEEVDDKTVTRNKTKYNKNCPEQTEYEKELQDIVDSRDVLTDANWGGDL